MELEEAWAELGVPETSGHDAARRTYLRLLKTRKPEADPKGFARLREAWETVRAALNGQRPPTFGQENAAPVVTLPVEVVPAPAVTPELEPAAREALLARFRQELGALPPEAAPGLAVEIARRAVVALPREVDPLGWLAEALSRVGDHAGALRILREGVNRGLSGALQKLALHFPAALTETEFAQVVEAGPPQLLWLVADGMRDIGRLDRTVQLVRVALDQVIPNFDHPPPPPDWFAALILDVHAEGDPADAAALFERYDRWLRENDLADTFRREGVSHFWPWIQELGQLPSTFPQLLRRVLARCLLDGRDPGSVHSAFDGFARYAPEEAEAAIPTLRARPLFAPFGETLKAALVQLRTGKAPKPRAVKARATFTPPVPGTRRTRGTLRVLWYVIFLGMLGMRFVCNDSGPDQDTENAAPYDSSSRR